MRERPIIFSAPMVRAILAGHKTQTRRPVRVQPDGSHFGRLVLYTLRTQSYYGWGTQDAKWVTDDRITCPYGQPGDRLWVREAWGIETVILPPGTAGNIKYRADHPADDAQRWRPSIHIPRWASRITLEVTAVRVERVQEITETDARSEGAPDSGQCNRPHFLPGEAHRRRLGFANIWDAIYAARGQGWDANPWVWVIEFRRVEGNGQN